MSYVVKYGGGGGGGGEALISEITQGKEDIAAAINAKGGTADPLESFQQLAQDIINLNKSFITYGVEVTEKIHWLKFICDAGTVPRLPLTAIDDDVVTTISTSSTFKSCSALESVKMTALTTINGGNVFESCISLQVVNMPNLINFNSSQAFQNCTALQNVNIPHLVTSSGGGVFSGCAALRNVAFGTLTYIYEPFVQTKANIRNITIGQDTNINLPFQNWTANNVIAEGQSGIDELNSNIMTNLVPNLYLNGGKTLRLGTSLYDVLTTATKDAITDRGWTLQRG